MYQVNTIQLTRSADNPTEWVEVRTWFEELWESEVDARASFDTAIEVAREQMQAEVESGADKSSTGYGFMLLEVGAEDGLLAYSQYTYDDYKAQHHG